METWNSAKNCRNYPASRPTSTAPLGGKGETRGCTLYPGAGSVSWLPSSSLDVPLEPRMQSEVERLM